MLTPEHTRLLESWVPGRAGVIPAGHVTPEVIQLCTETGRQLRAARRALVTRGSRSRWGGESAGDLGPRVWKDPGSVAREIGARPLGKELGKALKVGFTARGSAADLVWQTAAATEACAWWRAVPIDVEGAAARTSAVVLYGHVQKDLAADAVEACRAYTAAAGGQITLERLTELQDAVLAAWAAVRAAG